MKLVDQLAEIGKRKNASSSQITLAWILAQGDDFFPIPGTTNLGRLEENLAAAHIKLSSEEEREIRKDIEAAEVSGGRYPEAFASALFADTPPL